MIALQWCDLALAKLRETVHFYERQVGKHMRTSWRVPPLLSRSKLGLEEFSASTSS